MTKVSWMRPAAIGLSTAALFALGGCSPKPAAEGSESARKWGDIAFEPCALASKQGLDASKAYCAKTKVAEDAANPKSRQIELNLAWIPSENGSLKDPIVFLAGGPGQAAVDYASYARAILAQANRNRDLLLIDQRGTGESNVLSCPKAEAQFELEDVQLTPAQQLEAMKVCQAEVATKADTRFYTTTDFVRDLETVRQRLKVPQYNLVGISYGTRVAQKYAQAHPANVRSMVLDGVVPNRLVVGGEFARQLDNALKAQDAYCAKDKACKAEYGGNLSQRLRDLRIRLNAAPASVQVRDNATNDLNTLTIDGTRLTALVQKLAYSPEAMSILPLLIKRAEQGDYQPLGSLINATSDNSYGIEAGLFMSVVCAEDLPRWSAQTAAGDQNSLLGRDFRTEYAEACKYWPSGTAPKDFSDTPVRQIPTLMLSGELDPVTPPAYAAEIAKFYPNGRQLTLKGSGHGSMMRGCTARLTAQFIDRGDAKSLDAKCLDSLGFIPPFTGFNGWEP